MSALRDRARLRAPRTRATPGRARAASRPPRGETNVSERRAASRPRAREHRPHQHRLRRRDRGVGVAHRRVGDRAALDHQPRPDREVRRVPQHEVGELADLDRAHLVGDPVRDRRVDRVLGDVALRAARCRRRRAWPPSRARSARCARSSRPRAPSPASREPIIEIAPRSCSTSSAAIVVPRMRLSANARSSGMRGLRWWQTISMSRCSSTVLTVCGRVGLVEDGRTFGCAGDA